MQATTAEQERLHAKLRQARALILSGRQQALTLRPLWGSYLLGETLVRLSALVEELENEVAAARALGDTEGESSRDSGPPSGSTDIFL